MTGTATQVLRPRGPQIERITDHRAKVVIEPLERGYGHTLGNALRRFLSSRLPKSKSMACCTNTPRLKACKKMCLRCC